MPDTKDEGGDGYPQHPAPAKTPPFRGPAGPAPARPPLRAAGPMTGRVTVPPFMPPIEQGGPRPGTASQPGPVVRPYAAPPVPSRRTATPVMLAAIDDAALTASVTAEHTTRAVPYDGEHYFAPVNSPLSSPGLASFSDDPALITVELRRMPQAYAAPVRPVPPAPEPERFADPADEAIPSIDAYVMRAESSGEDGTPDAEAITDDAVVAGMKETDLPPAPYFSIDPPALIAAAMPPMPGQEIVAAPAEVIAPSLEDIERERAALVEAIVGAVEHAAEDEDVARDRKIDRDAVRLFSADPFADDAEESRPPAPPSPFDDDPDVSHNMMSGRINDLADAPYAGAPDADRTLVAARIQPSVGPDAWPDAVGDAAARHPRGAAASVRVPAGPAIRQSAESDADAFHVNRSAARHSAGVTAGGAAAGREPADAGAVCDPRLRTDPDAAVGARGACGARSAGRTRCRECPRDRGREDPGGTFRGRRRDT